MDTIDITVVLAMPDIQFQLSLPVDTGTQARQAVALALSQGLVSGSSIDVDPMTAPLGVYGEIVSDDYLLEPGDRLEIYRPLQQDPKEWRRQRAK